MSPGVEIPALAGAGSAPPGQLECEPGLKLVSPRGGMDMSEGLSTASGFSKDKCTFGEAWALWQHLLCCSGALYVPVLGGCCEILLGASTALVYRSEMQPLPEQNAAAFAQKQQQRGVHAALNARLPLFCLPEALGVPGLC